MSAESYWSMASDPENLSLVQARSRRAGLFIGPPRIPLYCKGHRAGVALALVINNAFKDDYVAIIVETDPKAGKVGTWNSPPNPDYAFSFTCGTCGKRRSRRTPDLLNNALKVLGASDTRGYKITIT